MLVFGPRISLASARRQVKALKRKLDRVLAAYRLKSAANRIVKQWNIAVANKQPRPDPIDCVHIIADAGFRPKSWNILHGYIDHCQRYNLLPDAKEIINKLHPPRKLASLVAVLTNLAPAS